MIPYPGVVIFSYRNRKRSRFIGPGGPTNREFPVMIEYKYGFKRLNSNR